MVEEDYPAMPRQIRPPQWPSTGGLKRYEHTQINRFGITRVAVRVCLTLTLPVILISGDPSLQALPAIQAGAMRFLAKPLDPDALLQAVRQALSR
jgi:CheY-like chemotaxis protein